MIKKLRIILLVLSGILTLAILVTSILLYSDLPARIPTHFSGTGVPDNFSNKNFWSVFLLPIIMIIMHGASWLVYFFPQYSNIPYGLILNSSLDKNTKKIVFDKVKTNIVIIFAAVIIMLAYIQYIILGSGIGLTNSSLKPWIMIVWVVFLLGFGIFHSLYIWRIYKGLKK